jgi:two-component system, NarL family, response regulator YdfI
LTIDPRGELMARTSGEQRIRVLVSANSAVSRAGLESMVRDSELLRLSGSFVDSSLLGSQIRELQPDIILIDLTSDGLQFIEHSLPLGSVDSPISIVALIDHPEGRWIARALRRGVKAILPRDASSAEILWAIQTANSGLFLLNQDATHELMARFGSEPLSESREYRDELTEREIQILRKLAEGLGNKQIASSLAISEHTVKFHISSILDKLGASSRTEAVTIGIRMGLVLL